MVALAVLVAAARPAAAGDPLRHWKTLETAHFVVNYYEPLGEVGRRVAVVAERAHAVLVPVFGHEPNEKTQIILLDNTDGANGFARVLPRNQITLFATAPNGTSVLGDYDDWLYLLVAHEYTHILHLDSISGLPRIVNRLLGKTWSPNQIQPRWVIEGIATYEESKQSSSGRTRSALFHQELRTAVLTDAELDLDAITSGPRTWPRGTAAYLYGSHFLQYVFDRFGHDALRDLSWTYGSQPVPYGLNRAMRAVTGETFEQLYRDWREQLRARYELELEAIERRGVRQGRRLTFQTEINVNPQYTPSGDAIVWLQADGLSPARFRAIPRGSNIGDAYEVADLQRVGDFAMLRDGRMVVEQTAIYRTEYNFQDLFLWSGSEDMTRLTLGMRARDPAVSPDERHVAFSMNHASQSLLAVMPLRAGGEPTVLWRGGRWDQVDRPSWSPDGRHIAFSAWRQGGFRDILIVDATTGELIRELSHDRAQDQDPVYGPDGRYLYFASDRTGIYNIYAYDLEDDELYQVTNVVGGALSPSISPDGTHLAYQAFVGRGWDLYELELDPRNWLEPELYVNERPAPTVVTEAEVALPEPRDYRALETLAPQAFTLSLGTNVFGPALSVQTGGGDVVGLHAYSMAVTLGGEADVSFGGAYSYNRFWPSLRVAAGRNANRRGGVVIDGVNTNFDEDVYRLTFSAGLPVLRQARGSANINLDYDVDWLRNTGDAFDEPDPNDTVPSFPTTDAVIAGASLRFSYSDVRGAALALGPLDGQEISASVRYNHPALGSDFRSLVLGYTWRGYKSVPWSDRSSLSLRLSGGIRTAESGREGAFVLGSVPQQNVVDAIINSVRFNNTTYLRGYPVRAAVGTQFHLANFEYRHLLGDIERGLGTLPVYVRRLHVAGLVDSGDAFDGELDPANLKVSVGAALRLDVVFGYFIPGSFDIGYARGLTSGGINETWMLLTGTL